MSARGAQHINSVPTLLPWLMFIRKGQAKFQVVYLRLGEIPFVQ